MSIPHTWGDGIIPSYLYRLHDEHFGFARFVEARKCKAEKQVLLCPQSMDFEAAERCHESFLQRAVSNMHLFVQGPGTSNTLRMFRLCLQKVRAGDAEGSESLQYVLKEETNKQAVQSAWESFQACEPMKHVVEGGCEMLKQPYGFHEHPLSYLSPLEVPSRQAVDNMSDLDVIRAELRTWVCLPAYTTITSYKYGDGGSEGHGWGQYQGGAMRLEGFCNVHDCFISVPLLLHEERQEAHRETDGSGTRRHEPVFASSFFPGQKNLNREMWESVTSDSIQVNQGGKHKLLTSMVDVIKYHDLHSTTVVQMLDGKLFQFSKNPGIGNSTDYVSKTQYRDVRMPKHHYIEERRRLARQEYDARKNAGTSSSGS